MGTTLLSLRLLGPVEVHVGGQPVALRRKTKALLAFLAVTGQIYRRQKLAELFCQEANDPSSTLRLLLSRLRRQLSPEILLLDGDTVQFNPQAAWVDCYEFEQALNAPLSTQTLAGLEAAISLYRGEFLAGLSLSDAPEFELWLLGEQARLRRLYERGLAETITRLIEPGDYEAALRRAQQLAQSNPLLEEPHAHLMWLYAKTGQRDAALAQFDHYRSLLQQELAVSPTPELVALRHQIVANQIEISSRPIAAAKDLRRMVDFVGRAGELAQLQQAWQSAGQGHGSVILIEAEAGGGKTRLVQEFRRLAPEPAFLLGQCYESAQTLPYSPWIELLETRLSHLNDTLLAQLSTFGHIYLSRLLPALAKRRRRSLPPEAPTSGGETERLFAAIIEFLFRLPTAAASTPQVLFIDNLQWADEASLRLFHFMARRLASLKAVLIGAFRREEAEEAPALQTLLHDLGSLTPLRLPLPPLDLAAVTRLAGQLWPKLPPGYRSHVCQMLAQATGGNPLFVTEVLHELSATSEAPETLPVPNSVRELIRRRLQRLPESGQQVIEAIAVLGLPVTPEQARQTSARSEEETFHAIDWGLRQRLLLPRMDFQPPHYDFSHDLVREAVVDQLSQIRRQVLHRRAATTLETTPVAPATLAYHWRMAGDPANQLTYTILAGQQAAAQFAHPEAVTYMSRALELSSPTDLAGRYELLSLREQAYGAQGVREAQRQDLSLLKNLAEALADKQRQITVALRQAALDRDTSQFDNALTAAQFAVQLAETIADVAQQARGHVQWGLTLWRQGDYEAAQAHLEQGRHLSQQAGLPAEEATGNLALSAIYRAWGDYEQAVARMEQALQLSRDIGDWQNEAGALNDLGVIAHDQGDYPQADARYRQALEIYRHTGDRWNQALTMGNHGGLFIDLGDYETARVTVAEAAQIFIEVDDRRALSYQYCDLSLIAHYQGDQQTALAHSRRALELATAVGERPGQANALIKLGHAQAGLGHPAEAVEAYQQALTIERELGQLSPAMEALAGLARMALAQNDLALAQAYLQEILDYLEHHTLAGAWEPFRVYLTGYQVLQAGQDSRARDILQAGYHLLRARADKIDDPAVRRRYLAEVIVHREIVEAYEG